MCYLPASILLKIFGVDMCHLILWEAPDKLRMVGGDVDVKRCIGSEERHWDLMLLNNPLPRSSVDALPPASQVPEAVAFVGKLACTLISDEPLQLLAR